MQHRLFALLAALTVAFPGTAQAADLNDTGITSCSNNTAVDNSTGVQYDFGSHPRQDCRYGRDPAAAAGMAKIGDGGKGFDFSKIANDGSVLPASAVLGSAATQWACTRDNVTGLIWEVKTASGLRGWNHVYSWYNSDAATNGGNAGKPSGGSCATSGRCDTEKFVADVNAARLCGAAGWRMPTKSELISIVDYGRTDPAIDPTYFPNTNAGAHLSELYFWASSTRASNSGGAWRVYFGNGFAWLNSKLANDLVRLVRVGQ
ncbi:MAG: DUF1566 domain-containing protein [Comamonadaceae bacterium]|nr:DUF1566 domain-containing protein [Comamonadaceae bacterium]